MANKPVMPKRDRAKRKRIELQADDIDLPMIPAELTIANLLPEKMNMPKFWGTDDAEFARFFDEHFPSEDERFAAFRKWVNGPSMLVPWQGGLTSKIVNYWKIGVIRERWWAAAHINGMVARITKSNPGLLRICGWCQKLFIANRNQLFAIGKK